MARDTGGLTPDQWYYRNVRKYQQRETRRKDKEARCEFCTIFLTSKFGTKLRRKYCDDCAASPNIQKYLHNLYQRRAYQKRTKEAFAHLEALGV